MKNIGIVYAILASIVWGLDYVILQKTLVKISPIALLLVQSLITVIVLLPFAFTNFESVRSLDKTALFLIVLSSITLVLANFLIFSSIKLLGAPMASVIEISYPFFVTLFAFLFFRTPLNWFFFLGAIFIFIGSLIIIKLA